MRILVPIAIMLSFAFATPASASPTSSLSMLRIDAGLLLDAATLVDSLGRPDLSLVALPTMPIVDALATAAPTVPAHYAWIERDTRAFWYAAGAGAVTTLGVHVLGGIPTLAIGGTWIGALAGSGFPTAVAAALGLFLTYTAAESAISALVSTLVFNTMSTTYEANYLSGFLGHFAGGVAATAVTGLTFGGGMLLLHGVGILTEFTGGAGLNSLLVFSFLGAMPAVVIAGTALVAVPALATAWALSAGASAKPGYAIDDQWQSPGLQGRLEDPTRSIGAVAVAMPVTVPLPVP